MGRPHPRPNRVSAKPSRAEPPSAVGIRTDQVSKRFGRQFAVKDVSLIVRQGELFGLLGPNGAGKTTLFSMLSTQLRPSSGKLWVNGVDVVLQPKKVRSMIGIVPQQAAAYEKLTAWENMILFGELQQLTGINAERRSNDLLRMVGLYERRDDLVRTFSGGMKHRLNIVLGLIHNPQVVFFDEPTTGLDPIARRGLWEIIRKLQASGKTIVLTTHYMQEAEELCDRVAILNRGSVVLEGEPRKMGRSLEEAFFQCTTDDDVTHRRGRA